LFLQEGKQLGLQGIELEEGLQLFCRHIGAEQGTLLVHVSDQLPAPRGVSALVLLRCDVADPQVM
jgi:hypothetical protein